MKAGVWAKVEFVPRENEWTQAYKEKKTFPPLELFRIFFYHENMKFRVYIYVYARLELKTFLSHKRPY